MAYAPTAEEERYFFICASAKCLAIFMGICLLFFFHFQKLKALKGCPVASRNLILPLYSPVIIGLILALALEVFLSFLHAFQGYDPNNIATWGLYEWIRDGFPLLFTLHGLGPRSFRKSLLFSLIPVIHGCLCGFLLIYIDIYALYLYESLSVLYNVMIALRVYPFHYRRSSIIPYTTFMALYRTITILYYLTTLSFSDQLYSTLYYPLLILIGIMETPLMILFYFSLRADTHYWREGAGASTYFSSKKNYNYNEFDNTNSSNINISHSASNSVGSGTGSLSINFLSGGSDKLISAAVSLLIDNQPNYFLSFAHIQIFFNKVLGHGSSCIVYDGKYKNETAVACKFWTRWTNIDVNETIIERIECEMKLSCALSHANIVKTYGLCVSPPSIFLVMEKCSGSLFDYLAKEREEAEALEQEQDKVNNNNYYDDAHSSNSSNNDSDGSKVKGNRIRAISTTSNESTTSNSSNDSMTPQSNNHNYFHQNQVQPSVPLIGNNTFNSLDNPKTPVSGPSTPKVNPFNLKQDINMSASSGNFNSDRKRSLSGFNKPLINETLSSPALAGPALGIYPSPNSSNTVFVAPAPLVNNVNPLTCKQSLSGAPSFSKSFHKSYDHLISLCIQATRPIVYLHSLSHLHRDIKSLNYLIGLDGNLKLTDFGLSKLGFGKGIHFHEVHKNNSLSKDEGLNEEHRSHFKEQEDEIPNPLHIKDKTNDKDYDKDDSSRWEWEQTDLDNHLHSSDHNLDHHNNHHHYTTRVGTLAWMSPEMILGLPYSYPSDVYSLTLVLWEIVSGMGPPFSHLINNNSNGSNNLGDLTRSQLESAICDDNERPPIPPHLPMRLQMLLARGWSPIPRDRPTALWILKELEDIQAQIQTIKSENSLNHT